MEKDVLVKVQNVSKKFCYDLKTSLKYGAVDIARSTLGLKTNKELRNKEFWAVKDVSFELRRGECIGLIGHNGAGKSTLLKVLNGLYAPDKGQITMKGKVGALIELGAGFNPILTGRENIYNNAAVLGFTREEVNEKMESIIAFSEIEKFLDTPVKNYSSGMKVRLGFAVAAHLEPDILIIDEVLAVGDLGFVLKCFKKIDELLPNTAVIFVSHSMPMISRMCTEVILMNQGTVEYKGTHVATGISRYYDKFNNSEKNELFSDGRVELINCYLLDNNNNSVETLTRKDNLKVRLKFFNKELTKIPHIALQVMDKEQRGVADVETEQLDKEITPNGFFEVEITIPNIQFSNGRFSLNMIVSEFEDRIPILRSNNILFFKVEHKKEAWKAFLLDSNIRLVTTGDNKLN